jgi:hypothetical protein
MEGGLISDDDDIEQIPHGRVVDEAVPCLGMCDLVDPIAQLCTDEGRIVASRLQALGFRRQGASRSSTGSRSCPSCAVPIARWGSR